MAEASVEARGAVTGDLFVSIVMPCLNEEQAIGDCVDLAYEGLDASGVRGEVVVADNGSTDRSVEIARARGARVVHESNQGYGAALQAAIEAAEGDVVIMGDSDGSHDWRQIDRFLGKLEEGYELVVGNRFMEGVKRGAMPWVNQYLGNPFFFWLSARVYKIPIADFHCGMRAFYKSHYKRMNLKASGMEFATEMIVKADRVGIRLGEVPITVQAPRRSRKPHLRPFRDGWRHLRFIMTYAPNYLYLVPGGVVLLLGVGLQLLLVMGPLQVGNLYLGIHFLALGCLLTMVGAHVIWFGILAKVIVSGQDPMWESRMASWFKRSFRLEIGLLVGGALMVVGFVVDAAVAWRWVSGDGPMDDSVHAVFVATTAIAVGIQLVFFAFLLHLALVED